MATRKANPAEKLDAANMTRVISLLEAEKPITKKLACEMLNISYNVTRLGTLIEKFKDQQATIKRRRSELRGKPPTPDEIRYIVAEYMEGATIDSITEKTYRGNVFVKNVLEEAAVPERGTGATYFVPELVPEPAMRDRFAIGEMVYSMRYDSPARIDVEQFDKKRNCYIYRIWLTSEKWLQCAWQEVYELSSLEHLRNLGVKI
jgi:hypothetical protein